MNTQQILYISAISFGLLCGCGPTQGNGNTPTEPPMGGSARLEGVWTADVHWQTIDGEPYDYKSALAFRFEPSASGWSCHRSGLAAQTCTLTDDDLSTLYYQDRYTRDYGSYVRTVTTSYNATHATADLIEMAFTAEYVYEYDSGSTYYRTFTGQTWLHPVDPADALPDSGLIPVGEFGDFSSSGAAKHLAHDEGGLDDLNSKASTGLTANVRVKDGYAYLARFSEGFYVVDISDPQNPVEVAHETVASVGAYYYNDVKLFEALGRQYAALCDDGIGLVVYDVTDPTQPVFVSSFFDGLVNEFGQHNDYFNNHTVFMVGTTAYMGNYQGSYTFDPYGEGESGGLLIVDLSDPANPQELGRWHAREAGGHFVHDLMVTGDVAYLASWEAGLVALDVSDPSNLRMLGQFTYDRMTSHSVWVGEVAGRKIAAHGDEDFGSHLRIVDVDQDSPTFMEEIGAFQLRPHVSIHNVMIDGTDVIAAHYQDGLRVFDISDPTQPTLKAWYNTWSGYPDSRYGMSFYEGAIGVDYDDNYIYLADLQRGLLIFQRDY